MQLGWGVFLSKQVAQSLRWQRAFIAGVIKGEHPNYWAVWLYTSTLGHTHRL